MFKNNNAIFEIKEKIKKKSSITANSSVLNKKEITLESSNINLKNNLTKKIIDPSTIHTNTEKISYEPKKEDLVVPKTHKSALDIFPEDKKDLFCKKTKKRKTKW